MLREASADLLSEAAPARELCAAPHFVRWTGYVQASVLARARLDFRCWRQLFIIGAVLVPSNAANTSCAQHVMWLYSMQCVGREALKHYIQCWERSSSVVGNEVRSRKDCSYDLHGINTR